MSKLHARMGRNMSRVRNGENVDNFIPTAEVLYNSGRMRPSILRVTRMRETCLFYSCHGSKEGNYDFMISSVLDIVYV